MMISAQEVRSVTFEKAMRGYRVDEVDEYLDQVAQAMDALQEDKADMEKKLYILAEKVDQYRNDEETLKTALLNAQRLGETVVYEAKQKAETIIYDATTKANQAKEEAQERVASEENTLTQLKSEVAKFKHEVLNLYKQHIEALSEIPGAENRAPLPKTKGQEVQEVKKVVTETPVATQAFDPPAKESAPENPFTMEIEPAPVNEEQAGLFDNYQGIRFDD